MVRVFLADNHVLIRGGLRTLLRTRRDFSICGEANNGREAVKLAIQAKPDVVVMNVNLPDINGIEATRRIRRGTPGTEVLIFTAETNEDLMREALQAGARGYLLKSASDEQVIGAIEALAEHQVYSSSSVREKLLGSLTHQKRGDGNSVRLTVREREILRLIAEGHRGRKIAMILGISLKTVETHRTAGMRKLGLRSIVEVVRYAIREKLIQA
jgi:DNA-binding NarL/FixJ family response regulator